MNSLFVKFKNFVSHHKLLMISLCLILILLLTLIIYSASKNRAEYIKPRYGEIIEAIYGLGKVKTDRVFEVKLGVPSTVLKVFVKEGDFVKKGNLLIRFDDDVEFRAPFSGTITQVNVNEKQMVFPQQVVIRMEDFSSKYIEVSLEQQGALRVKPDQQVRVIFESIRGDQQYGKVSAVFSRGDEFLAHILVPALKENVLPGMTADVAIEVGKKDKALLVPLAAITNGRIIIKREGKILTMPLKIGSIDGNWAEVIESDLKVSDTIKIKRLN